MVVTFKFIGSLRSFSGKGKLTLAFDGSIFLKDAMKKIVDELPGFKSVLTDQERRETSTSMLVLVNGKEISVLKGFDTLIKDGGEVVFVPVSHGG